MGFQRALCVFAAPAWELGLSIVLQPRLWARLFVERGIELVYGGGNIGLMGVLADKVLALGGRVIGVIPESLMAREVGHLGLTESARRRIHARAQGSHV